MSAATDMLSVLKVTEKIHDCSTLRQAINNSFAEMRERIFVRGLDSNGAPIGSLSKDAGYFNPKDFPSPSGFSGKGKTGKNKFKSGKKHVTTYFDNGYNEAKTAGGRNLNVPGKADLYLTGQMRNSLLPDVECGKGGKALIGFSNDLAEEKADGNEDRFNTSIFDAAEKEIQIFIDTLNA